MNRLQRRRLAVAQARAAVRPAGRVEDFACTVVAAATGRCHAGFVLQDFEVANACGNDATDIPVRYAMAETHDHGAES